MRLKLIIAFCLSTLLLTAIGEAKTHPNMLVMSSKVTIGNYDFKGVAEVTTQSGWEMMTDVATVTVPRRLVWEDKPLVMDDNPILKKGNPVMIALGYNDLNHTVFDGYATAIHANMPITVDCQDDMWKLKTGKYNKSYRQVTLSELLKDMLNPIGVKYKIVAEHDLGMFRTKDNPTPAKVLDGLRKDYFVKFFFRDKTLYAGLAYVAELQKEHTIRFNRHVVENNLEYVKKEDVQIKIHCVILKPDNKKEEFDRGDSEGEVRTIHKYNISKAAMEKFVDAEMERLRYDGYRGSLTIFGEPFVQHGDIVRLVDDENLDHEGRFLVKSVGRKFSPQGYRQILEIEGKVS